MPSNKPADQGPYSQFTLNPYTGSNKKIAYRGATKVVDRTTGEIFSFRTFALGPYKSESGNMFFRTVFYPLDAELAILQKRMMSGEFPTPVPANAPANYDRERSRAGTGVLFPTEKDDRAREAGEDPDRVRTHFGSAVVLLDADTTLAIDTSTWGRRAGGQPGFAWHSGNADAHDPHAAAQARAAKGHSMPSGGEQDWTAAHEDAFGEPDMESARTHAEQRSASGSSKPEPKA